MAAEIFQFKLSMKESKPLIWRRLLVRSDMTFAQFHKIIQIAMDWHDIHLHEFSGHDWFIGIQTEENEDVVDSEKNVQLKMVLVPGINRMLYRYDFGDDWRVTLALERRFAPKEGEAYPVCTGGEQSAPPENAGGMWSYYDKLEIIKTPAHPAYAETREWMGKTYNPEFFDLEAVNQELRKVEL